MKLYYSPGACSLSPHIALREAGLPFTIEKVDTKAGTTETGKAFATVNPKGYVPALQLDDGAVLTEGAAIVQFIADLAPDAGLAPKAGTFARARLQEELNFVATELHKAFVPLLRPTTSEDGKRDARAIVARRLDHVEKTLSDGRDHLLGKDFSVADAYLFTVVNWGGHVGLALEPWPRLQAFMSRVATRDSVRQAMRAEGLVQ
ncbi:glutathione S-transferase [Bosea sp. OK403]|uniref:glutathione transferase GstA n=1 Tax=Bosea sp. OK403 TaxID=1855286 RepID=UPI0008F28DEE|nr:glutathione transferase GstA [Bosea sp. OK403]SFI29874.1 glutathione S-transferase [Bosea sp. OK403]